MSSYYDSVIVADGAVSFWTAGEASGTTAADSADSNPGTYSGGFTLGSAGIGDGETSVTLNGSTGGITFGTPSNLRFTTACSLEAWVYPTAASETATIVVRGTRNNEYDWNLSIAAGVPFFRSDIAGIGTVSATTALAVNQWNHIVATYNGSSISFYRNGALDKTDSVTSSTLLNDSQTSGYAGADLGSSYGYLAGRLAKVAAYATVLSATQISKHYAAATGAGHAGNFLAFV